jgi:archaellum component FlaC
MTDTIDLTLGYIDGALQGIDGALQGIVNRLDRLENTIATVTAEIHHLNERFDVLEQLLKNGRS